MPDTLVALYPWTKSFHIISFVAWMAGLFYLPRLFVYHAEAAPAGSAQAELFEIMERRLLRAIMTPAMIATWVFGVLLALTPGVVSWEQDLWIYAKLGLVLLLTWFHHWCGRRRAAFAENANTHSGRFYRAMNELPTLVLIGIVVLVVTRPF